MSGGKKVHAGIKNIHLPTERRGKIALFGPRGGGKSNSKRKRGGKCKKKYWIGLKGQCRSY